MTLYTTAPQRATGPNSQDLKRRAAFAKAAVYAEFSGRNARALDQGGFTDHSPQQIRRWRSEAVARRQAILERLAAALLLDDDGDDAEPSAA